MSENPAPALTWPHVCTVMAPSRNYWLNTISADGSPHVSAVWGVASDDYFYFYTSRGSIKARNLTRDNRAALHLESAQDVIIVHGHVEDLGDPTLSPEILSALTRKYDQRGDVDYLPTNDQSYDVLFGSLTSSTPLRGAGRRIFPCRRRRRSPEDVWSGRSTSRASPRSRNRLPRIVRAGPACSIGVASEGRVPRDVAQPTNDVESGEAT
jgi:hypothetical protein